MSSAAVVINALRINACNVGHYVLGAGTRKVFKMNFANGERLQQLSVRSGNFIVDSRFQIYKFQITCTFLLRVVAVCLKIHIF